MNFNWQEWVVFLLVVISAAYVSYQFYLFFRRTKEKNNPCEGCATGCELKSQFNKKQQQCGTGKGSLNKKDDR